MKFKLCDLIRDCLLYKDGKSHFSVTKIEQQWTIEEDRIWSKVIMRSSEKLGRNMFEKNKMSMVHLHPKIHRRL